MATECNKFNTTFIWKSEHCELMTWSVLMINSCSQFNIIWKGTEAFHFLQIEPIRNFFAALFLASIGMLIHVQFLWNHVDILLASVILVIIVKTVVISTVVKGFRYNNKTSLLVRLLWHWFVTCTNMINGWHLVLSSCIGGDVSGTNRGVCFCSSQSCIKPSSSWG